MNIFFQEHYNTIGGEVSNPKFAKEDRPQLQQKRKRWHEKLVENKVWVFVTLL